MQDHRKLRVYQESRELALQVYAIAAALPSSERFGLSEQMRRSAVSVGSNIAEGCGRGSHREFTSFLAVALGSCMELEFQLDLCRSMRMGGEAVTPACERAHLVQVMLTRLMTTVKHRHGSKQPDRGR